MQIARLLFNLFVILTVVVVLSKGLIAIVFASCIGFSLKALFNEK